MAAQDGRPQALASELRRGLVELAVAPDEQTATRVGGGRLENVGAIAGARIAMRTQRCVPQANHVSR